MKNGLRPAGFFLLRTPLLPFDALLSWARELESPGAAEPELEGAVAADRRVLRDRLRAAIEEPVIREALASASPSLLEGLPAWHAQPESEAGQKVERALVRYLARMASRPTPFALLAGVTVGEIGPRTHIELAPRSAYRRRTRLEAAEVHRLADTLAADPAVAATLRYRVSSGLTVLHDEVRVATRGERNGMRTWTPARVVRTAEIDAVIARATEAATRSELAAVASEGVVEELVARGALVHDLEPPLTGGEPLAWLSTRVAGVASPEVDTVVQTHRVVSALDGVGLGPDAAPSLPLQIDLLKPAVHASLATAVTTEIAAAVDALARLAPRTPDPLAKLREAYVRRFDDLETPRFVPLAELLDPDGGVGLDGPQGPHRGWIAELELPAPATTTFGARERFLLGKLTAALATGATEIRLEPGELATLTPATAIPDSLSVIATVAASPEQAEDFRVVVHHARASATRLLGRFAYLDEVRPRIADLTRAEAALHPGAVLAEVVHAPMGPLDLMGALHQRPVLRDHEIPLLARSGADVDHQLPIDDLLVSVRAGETILWSRRLRCRVLPRLSSAHRVEFRKGHVAAYRFLYAVETEGGGPPYLDWSWGVLDAPFLPRVTIGRAVLAPAEWHLGARDVAALDEPTPSRRMAAVRRLRERLSMPRAVSLVDVERPTFDNLLHLDLEHSFAVDAFIHAATTSRRAILRESFADPAQLVVTAPEGRFTHEIVVPFVRATPSAEVAEEGPSREDDRGSPGRVFPPGSSWLTLRVDAGMGRFDGLLLQHLLPVVRRALADGDADGWFFLRLGLPVPQLRLRLHGDPARLARPLAELERVIGELVIRREVLRSEWTTYEREVERYGGPGGVEIAEQIFAADSDAVVEVLASLPDRTDEGARERVTLVGVDRLLADLGLEPAARLACMEAMCARWRREFGIDKPQDIQLGALFRRDRPLLERALAGDAPEHAVLDAIYRARSERVRPLAAELTRLRTAGVLTLDVPGLAPSFAHMHAIRMAVRHSRVHELVIYDFLRRLYTSQVARARKPT